MKDKLKLHLGCGKVHIPGFVNIDQYDNDSVNVVDDVKKLSKFQSNSVDLIYAAHVLEHFTRWEYKDVLRRWKELLKPNGILRIAVPDFEVISKYYIKTKDIIGHTETGSPKSCPNLIMPQLRDDVAKKKGSNNSIKSWDWSIISGFISLFNQKVVEIKEYKHYKNYLKN